MPKLTGLDHLVLTVADVGVSCAFYQRGPDCPYRGDGADHVALYPRSRWKPDRGVKSRLDRSFQARHQGHKGLVILFVGQGPGVIKGRAARGNQHFAAEH